MQSQDSKARLRDSC